MNTIENVSFPLRIWIFHYIRIGLAIIVRFLCQLYYGDETEIIPVITDDILKQPAIEVARKIRCKEISSVEVLEICIRRIRDINLALNCFVEDRFELAMKEARKADDLISSGALSIEELENTRPLLGVPFTTKDCISVKGLHNTSGVVLRKDVIAEDDADGIKLLRGKGAIIIGLTNVPELCMWWESHNHIYGRTCNPYNTTRIVGGSSGGEGTIQAAAGSIFGVGSDIGGSIRMPAFFNGVFGHKPSRNTVSNRGQYPAPESDYQNSFLGTGPMTRFAVDLKPLLKIMAGDKSAILNLDQPVNIQKLKVYYQYSNEAPMTDPVDPDIIAAMDKVLEYLNKKFNINGIEKKIQSFKKTAPIWLGTMKTKKKFGEFIIENPTVLKIYFEILKNLFGYSGNTLVGLLMSLSDYGGIKYGDEKHQHFIKERDQVENLFTEMLGDDGVFLFPTHPTPAPYHNETLIKAFNFTYTAIFNSLGLPATHIPLGLSREGLPIGIQVVANHNNDRLCLAIAEELEKGFGGWVEPQKLCSS